MLLRPLLGAKSLHKKQNCFLVGANRQMERMTPAVLASPLTTSIDTRLLIPRQVCS